MCLHLTGTSVKWRYCRCKTYCLPSNSGRDDSNERMTPRGTNPPPVLQIHSLRQVPKHTPSHVALRHCVILIAIFSGFGTYCMVHIGRTQKECRREEKRMAPANVHSGVLGIAIMKRCGWPHGTGIWHQNAFLVPILHLLNWR